MQPLHSLHSRLKAAALVLLIAAVYAPVYDASFLGPWDDDQHVAKDPKLKSLAGLHEIWLDPTSTPQYYPLTHTAFWLEYRLWGLSPLGYHAVNVLVHAAVALLFWRLLVRLALPFAFWAALVFALHPVEVETVAWVSELKTLLSACFYLAALLALLGFEERPKWQTLAAAWAFFIAALLCKTVACTLPAAMLVIQWWRHGSTTQRDWLIATPLLAAGMALGLLTAWLERTHLGAVGEEWGLSAVDRLLVAGRAAWFYAGKLVLPKPLVLIYPRWQIDSHAWWQYAPPAAALALLAAAWLARKRIGRGPLAALLLFGGTLVPALGFFNVYPFRYSFVADHYQYLASIWLIALLTGVAARAAAHLPSLARYALVALAAVTLGSASCGRAAVFESPRSLWLDTLAKNPDALAAYNYLLTTARSRQEAIRILERAAEAFARAAAHRPLTAAELALYGGTMLELGQVDRARALLAEAVPRLPRKHELYAVAGGDLGITLLGLGREAEAAECLAAAYAAKPRLARVNYGLAVLAQRRGDDAAAERHSLAAFTSNPTVATYAYDAGVACFRQGKYADAKRWFETAFKLDPTQQNRQALASARSQLR